MQSVHMLKSLALGIGLMALGASQASAVVLFDSHGFEQSAGYNAGLSLAGQPASAPATERWDGVNTAGAPGGSAPIAGVLAYNPVNPALGQYALVQVTNNAAGSSGFFYPNHNLPTASGGAGPFVPGAGTDKIVAITFNMDVLSAASGSTAANDEFFGVVAYGSAGQIMQLGLNHRTGTYDLPVDATVIRNSPSGLGAGSLDNFHGYELLLNYQTNTWQIYSQLVSGVSPFVLDAFGPFQSAATDFTDADLVAYNLGTGSSNGNAIFDDYLVQTLVPEPTSIAVGVMATGVLLGRRRRGA